jgi:hypothetical protein
VDVGLLLLFQALMQELLIVAKTELARQCRGGAVGGDLVMLDLLGGGDQGGVAQIVALHHRQHLFGLEDQRPHRLVGVRPRVGTIPS